MALPLAIGLIVLGIIVGWFDTFVAQREYADRYAARYGRIPPLTEWFFTPDRDPEIERLRQRHRNLWLLTGFIALAAIVAILAR